MVAVIDALSSGQKNAEQWVAAHRMADGFADVSSPEWESSLAVIEGVELDRMRLVGNSIRPNFVNSHIMNSQFSRVTTDGHFWGAGNHWQSCSFTESLLRSVISPQNRFVNCEFESVVFDGYEACETLFESCRFVRCSFEALRTRQSQRSRSGAGGWLAALRSSLQFAECQFQQSQFRHCGFAGTSFLRCKFEGSSATQCNFDGIRSDTVWWPDSAKGDVFLAFLDQLIAEILAALGTESSAANVLSEYKRAYVRGGHKNKDYSACLYTGNVPHAELDIVEEILDRLGPRFGM